MYKQTISALLFSKTTHRHIANQKSEIGNLRHEMWNKSNNEV